MFTLTLSSGYIIESYFDREEAIIEAWRHAKAVGKVVLVYEAESCSRPRPFKHLVADVDGHGALTEYRSATYDFSL